MEELDYTLHGGPPAWLQDVPVLLVVIVVVALLGASLTRWARRAGAWYFTFGALFVMGLGGVLAAMSVVNIFQADARVGGTSLGAAAAGFEGSLRRGSLAALGAMILAAAGAVSGARAAALPGPRSVTTRRSLLPLAMLAALFASAAIACVTLTGRVAMERLSVRNHDDGLAAVMAATSALPLAAFITGALAMALSITGSALAVFSDRADDTGSRRMWILPGLILVAALVVALIAHHETAYYLEVAKTGALPRSPE